MLRSKRILKGSQRSLSKNIQYTQIAREIDLEKMFRRIPFQTSCVKKSFLFFFILFI